MMRYVTCVDIRIPLRRPACFLEIQQENLPGIALGPSRDTPKPLPGNLTEMLTQQCSTVYAYVRKRAHMRARRW